MKIAATCCFTSSVSWVEISVVLEDRVAKSGRTDVLMGEVEPEILERGAVE